MKWSNCVAIQEQAPRSKSSTRLASVLLAVMALLLPLCAGAGDKVFKEGVLLEGPVKAKDSMLGTTANGVGTKNWIFVVKVGDYKYGVEAYRVGGLLNFKKKPKTDDWQANSPVQVHFHRRSGSLYMDMQGPNGKKEDGMWVFSKVGPDGKELCGKFKCTKTAEDAED
jgi:hypothetical protein